jgi:hypothetical protein
MPGARPWKGARLLAVSAEINEKDVQDGLKRVGLKKFWSLDNQLVQFFDFSGIATVRLASLGSILENDDPRYDAYLKALPRFFFATGGGKEFRLYYIVDPGFSTHDLIEALGPADPAAPSWLLVEARSARGYFLPTLVSFVFALLVCTGFPWRKWFGIVFLCIPFVFCLYSGRVDFSVLSLCLCYCLSAFYRAFLRYPYEKKYTIKDFIKIACLENRPKGILFFSIATVGIAVSLGYWAILGASISAILIIPCGLWIESMAQKGASRVFVPLRLRSGRRLGIKRGDLLIDISPALAAVFIMEALFSPLPANKDLLSIPRADRYTSGGESGAGLPSVQDYRYHARFQAEFSRTNIDGSGAERPYIEYAIDDSGVTGEKSYREGSSVDPEFKPSGIEAIMALQGSRSTFSQGSWPGKGDGRADGPIAWTAVAFETALALFMFIRSKKRGAAGYLARMAPKGMERSA